MGRVRRWRAVDPLDPQASFQHPRSGAWYPQNRNFAAGTEGRDITVATAPIAEATSCSLENYLVLPDHSMDERIREAKETLGDRKSTRLNSSHSGESRMPSSA